MDITRKRVLWGALGAVAVAAIAGLFLLAMQVATQPGQRPAVGSPAPDFDIGLYAGYRDGLPERIRLSDLRGKVVVMNFWAEWCVECKKEAAALELASRRFKDRGVVFLGVNYLDQESAALKYLRDYAITYPNGFDQQQRISRAYRITGVPETFVIDRDGTVRHVIVQQLTEGELNAMLSRLVQ